MGDANHPQFDHVAVDQNGQPILDRNGNYTGTSQMKFRGHSAEENIRKLVNGNTQSVAWEFDKCKDAAYEKRNRYDGGQYGSRYRFNGFPHGGEFNR